jgi:hypothetical protein
MVVAKEAEKLEGLSKAQLLDLRIETLRALDAAIAEKIAANDSSVTAGHAAEKIVLVSAADQLARCARLPLTEAIPEYLATCKKPQTAKQIVTALIQAGREFETSEPVHSVRTALQKIMAVNDDVFHVYWAKYHLKSKYRGRKAQLEALLAKNNRFGTGGHSKQEHAKRTSEGIAKRRKKGLRWGPVPKATPEVIERAKQMMRDGTTLTETCRQLNIAIPTLYQFGIRQRVLLKEGELQRQKQAQQESTEPGADVIPLHGRTG